jgi:acyl dehydratase
MADRGQPQALRGQGLAFFLQLDQLRAAKRSPVGGSEKDEDESFRTHEGLEGVFPAGLVGQGEARHLLADLGTQGVDVEGRVGGHDRITQKGKGPQGTAAFQHRAMVHHPPARDRPEIDWTPDPGDRYLPFPASDRGGRRQELNRETTRMASEQKTWTSEPPRVGQRAERTRNITAGDIELFTAISGDRNPLHYDEAAAKATPFGGIVVQGGITSAILNAVVAEDLPGPGTVFLHVDWSFKAPVRPGDAITGAVEVLKVRTDKPITELKTTVTRDDGTVVLDGHAVCYTMPL